MGLLLSVLVACVGVVELLAFYTNVRRNFVPILTPANLHDLNKKYLEDLKRHRKELQNQIAAGAKKRHFVGSESNVECRKVVEVEIVTKNIEVGSTSSLEPTTTEIVVSKDVEVKRNEKIELEIEVEDINVTAVQQIVTKNIEVRSTSSSEPTTAEKVVSKDGEVKRNEKIQLEIEVEDSNITAVQQIVTKNIEIRSTSSLEPTTTEIVVCKDGEPKRNEKVELEIEVENINVTTVQQIATKDIEIESTSSLEPATTEIIVSKDVEEKRNEKIELEIEVEDINVTAVQQIEVESSSLESATTEKVVSKDFELKRNELDNIELKGINGIETNSLVNISETKSTILEDRTVESINVVEPQLPIDPEPVKLLESHPSVDVKTNEVNAPNENLTEKIESESESGIHFKSTETETPKEKVELEETNVIETKFHSPENTANHIESIIKVDSNIEVSVNGIKEENKNQEEILQNILTFSTDSKTSPTVEDILQDLESVQPLEKPRSKSPSPIPKTSLEEEVAFRRSPSPYPSLVLPVPRNSICNELLENASVAEVEEELISRSPTPEKIHMILESKHNTTEYWTNKVLVVPPTKSQSKKSQVSDSSKTETASESAVLSNESKKRTEKLTLESVLSTDSEISLRDDNEIDDEVKEYDAQFLDSLDGVKRKKLSRSNASRRSRKKRTPNQSFDNESKDDNLSSSSMQNNDAQTAKTLTEAANVLKNVNREAGGRPESSRGTSKDNAEPFWVIFAKVA